MNLTEKLAEVHELRDTVYAFPRSIVQKTVFAVTARPEEWSANTLMTCLSGPEARAAVLLSVHRDSCQPARLSAWAEAVTSAAVEFRRVPDSDLVTEYVVLQEIIEAFRRATSLTVPHQALLVSAALRQSPAGVDQCTKLFKQLPLTEPPAQPLLICPGLSSF